MNVAGEPVSTRARSRLVSAVLAAWVLLLLGSWVWGRHVRSHARGDLFLGAMPLFGTWKWMVTARLAIPLIVALLCILLLPLASDRWSWRAIMSMTTAAVVVWSAALAYVDAPHDRWSSIHDDYGAHVGLIDAHGIGTFLRTYVDNQKVFPTHLQAHPPGMVVLLWSAQRFGLHGHWFDGSLALVGSAVAAVAALVVLRDVAGERWARRAVPFVVLAPAAVWHASADSVFAGMSMLAVAVLIISTGRVGGDARRCALAGGVLFGAALLLSYGVVLLALPVALIAIRRRALGQVLVAGATAIVTLAVPILVGFSWLGGLAATKRQYDLNLAVVRPYSYFVIANLAVFALAIGPATVVGMARLGRSAASLVISAGVLVVVVADVTGLSIGETERIWQPFMPLVLLAGSLFATSPRSTRAWLGAQAAVALALEATLRSPW